MNYYTDVAVSLNNNDVTIYKKAGNKWSESGSLKEHGQRVTGIDWAAKSNRIVTCGAVSLVTVSSSLQN